MEEKIKEILTVVLEQTNIGENTSSETLEEWDSLRHINIIVAIEDEFDIELEDDDIMSMISFNNIISILKNKYRC